MEGDITEYIRTCEGCQLKKLVRIKNKQEMIIADTSIEPFYKISIDTVGPLPITPSENKHILTVQDNLTKYCIGVPISNLQAETIADALARNVIAIYGCPRVLLSDQAPTFLSKLMQEMARIFKIEKVNTSVNTDPKATRPWNAHILC